MHGDPLGRTFERLDAADRGRASLLGGFLVGVAGVLAAGTLLRRRGRSRAAGAREAAIDDAVEASFPASDPPSHAPAREAR
jgi:hypothetical protein